MYLALLIMDSHRFIELCIGPQGKVSSSHHPFIEVLLQQVPSSIATMCDAGGTVCLSEFGVLNQVRISYHAVLPVLPFSSIFAIHFTLCPYVSVCDNTWLQQFARTVAFSQSRGYCSCLPSPWRHSMHRFLLFFASSVLCS